MNRRGCGSTSLFGEAQKFSTPPRIECFATTELGPHRPANGLSFSPASGLPTATLADPPTAVDDLAATFQNQTVTISVLTNDFDTETNQLGILQVSAPSHGTVVINTNGPVTTAELSRLFQFSATQLSNTVLQLGNTNLYPRSTMTNGTWETVDESDLDQRVLPQLPLVYIPNRPAIPISKHGHSNGRRASPLSNSTPTPKTLGSCSTPVLGTVIG